ncbi:Dabb family protein [Clostridium polynesiense]|uniref:Dabb family protein n=1 Tax=Clostridium polynesiense TaxID=1325933 RepID=UPI00058DA5F0|nr:Dabb family protein [Clostridium polynesiense]
MVKHIVMWRIKDHAEGKSKKDNCLLIKNDLEGLKSKIPGIINIEVGINILMDNAAYDLVLYSEFEDYEGLNQYQNHEEHLKVAKYIGLVKEDRIVVDYEK